MIVDYIIVKNVIAHLNQKKNEIISINPYALMQIVLIMY